MDIGATGLGLIDYAIFIVALVAVLIVGLFSGGKIKTLADYATSRGKKFSTPVLVMTMLATAIGSNTSIGSISEIYNNGLIYIIEDTLTLIGTFLLIQYAAKFIAGRYPGVISLYGIVEQEYGTLPAKVSSAFAVFDTMISLSMQIIGMAYVVKTFLGIPFIWGASISTAVFVLYSSVGGIRSVVYTDVLQFLIILVVFPILTGIVIYNAGGIDEVLTAVPKEKLQIIDHPDFVEYSFLATFWMMPFSLLLPIFVQRFLMCSDSKELRHMGLTWVLFRLVFIVMLGIIGLSGVVLLSDVSSGKEVIPALMKNYLPIGLKGLAITTFFAIIMSTADSYLNAAAVLISEIMMNKGEREKRDRRELDIAMGIDVEEDDSDRKQIRRARIGSFILGGGAFLIALLDFSFIKVTTIASAIAFGAINIPVFFAPFKKRKLKSINAYMGSIIGGVGSFLLFWGILGQERVYMVSTFAAFFAIGGWFIGANFFDKNKTTFWRNMRIICTPIGGFSKFLSPPQGYGYITVFGIISFLMRYGLYPWKLFSQGYLLLSVMLILSCVLLLILAFGDRIKGSSNNLFLTLWIITIFLAFPFYNMLALLHDPGNIINSASLLIALFLTNLLFDWRVSLLMLLVSFLLVSALNTAIYHQEALFSSPDQIFLAIYAIMAGVLVGMFLKRMWDSASEEKLEYAYIMAGSVAHELQTPIMEVGGWLEFIPPNSLDKNSITQDKLDEIKKVLLSIRGSYNNSVDTIRRTMQVFTMGRQGRDVVDTDLNMAELVADAVKTVRIEDSKRDRIRISISPDLVVHAYANNLITILHNLIRNAAMYSLSKDKKATIRIYNEGRDVIVYDDGVGIRSDRILTIFDRGTSYDSKRGSGFGLYYCKIEMERLGGRIRCYSREGEFTKFVLSFPEVRAKKAHKNRPVKRNRMRFQ
jgi:Na+/proline symporter/signal transduction histidine kinase